MRAKEYLKNKRKTISNYNIIQQIVDDLYNIRLDEEATKEYYERILLSDIRFNEWEMKHSEWQELHKKYGASEREPELVKFENEIDKRVASNIREDLLKVVRDDETFGYIFHLLFKEQGNVPSSQTIERAIYQEISNDLIIAENRILDLEKQLNESAKKTEIAEGNQLSLEQAKDGKRTMKVTTDVLIKILEKIDVKKNDTADATKISDFISYVTGFSAETIRQRLSNTEELTNYHREEVEKVNKLLNELRVGISIKYNTYR